MVLLGILFTLVIQGGLANVCDEEGGVEIEVGYEPGIITNPGYEEGKYPLFLSCSWVLFAPENKFIRFRFLDIELPKHRGCVDDHVQVEYENEDSPLFYTRFCGDKPPTDLIIPANLLPIVSFYSGRISKRMRGFKLEYSLLDEQPSCGEDFACKYPHKCISAESRCNGIGECYDGSDEENCGHSLVTPSECGQPAIAPAIGNDFDRIVGGRIAVENSWPWLVSLQTTAIYPSGHVCGGSLINNLWVLTAAHCIKSKEAVMYRVKFGEHNLFEDKESENIRFVEEIYIHEEYNTPFEIFNDIALLKLKSPVDFNKHVSTVCLPDNGEELATGTMFHITGWGDTRVSGSSDVLKQVMVPSRNWDECRRMHTDNRELAPNTICIGYEHGGQSSCFGDSGGPMVSQKDDKWTIYGIVSWGPQACGNPNEPAVLTKVSAYVPWILETIEKN